MFRIVNKQTDQPKKPANKEEISYVPYGFGLLPGTNGQLYAFDADRSGMIR
jgi:hypothetical protein